MPVFGTADELAAHRVVSQRVRDVATLEDAADHIEELLSCDNGRYTFLSRLVQALGQGNRWEDHIMVTDDDMPADLKASLETEKTVFHVGDYVALRSDLSAAGIVSRVSEDATYYTSWGGPYRGAELRGVTFVHRPNGGGM